MVKKITSVGDNLTFEDDVQTTKRELDEMTKGSFSDHDTRHEEAGADEVVPALHAARHETGGADVVVPDVHASRHEDSGADEIDITGLVGHQFGKNLLQNASFQDTDGDDLPDFWDLLLTPTLAIATDTLRPELKGNQITITGNGAIQEGIQIPGGTANWLKVLPSKAYAISFYHKASGAGERLGFSFRSYNGNIGGSTTVSFLGETVSTLSTVIITSDADADNLEIQFFAESDGDAIILSHVKVEQGAIATPYVDETVLNDLQIASGWRTITDTWTFASATTINVPAGAASLYKKGDKIKITNPGIKYFYIVVVADTLLTVTAGADFTVANSVITFPFYSHTENPLGFPASFTWVPTLDGGNADLSGFDSAIFVIQGTLLFYDFIALARNVGGIAGTIQVSLPVTSLSAGSTLNTVINDGAAFVTTIIAQNATNLEIFKTITLGNWATGEAGVNIYLSHFYRI